MILFLIRHGQTTANVDKLFYGQMEYPLTESGRKQAMALQPLLARYRFDRVYASDLSRAVETAKLAIPGCEPIQTPLLREYDIGSIAPIDQKECFARYGNLRGDYTPFGGENNQMVTQRLRSFLDQLEADPRPYVAAFSHNGTMKCLLRMILGTGIDTAAVQSGNCNVAVLRHNGDRWLVAAWNLAADLEGEIVL